MKNTEIGPTAVFGKTCALNITKSKEATLRGNQWTAEYKLQSASFSDSYTVGYETMSMQRYTVKTNHIKQLLLAYWVSGESFEVEYTQRTDGRLKRQNAVNFNGDYIYIYSFNQKDEMTRLKQWDKEESNVTSQ